MVKVRLLEVSLYARGPRRGDVCRDVAFHEEMPKILSRYTWNNTPILASMIHEAGKTAKQSGLIHLWWKNKPAEKPKRKRKKIFIPRLISKQS